MARKPMGMPGGVEIVGKSVRIRFTWKGATPPRRCETLPIPPTPAGIAQAASLRADVKQLIKLGVMTEEKYAELFPSSSYTLQNTIPLFGEYAQMWLDSREIVKGTRDNYKSTLNRYWMPHFAQRRIDQIGSVDCRRVVSTTEWPSPGVRRNACDKMSSIMESAVQDGLISRNPIASIARPRVTKKVVDPFTREEAEQIIAWLYENLEGRSRIYACYFEFAFFTGMRPCEQVALKWSEVDLKARTAHVCRVMVRGGIHERVKTKQHRHVLMNDRAMHALEEARKLTEGRSRFVFAPALMVDKSVDWIRSDSTTKEHFLAALQALGIRRRRQYDTRHTCATMCLMAGMNPAFIANQLGHSVQMLLSTYAKWLNSTSDWAELQKLD
ncbi:tyrosine-type recombinase/integrase [Pseudomonas sp. UBA7530]|uniref:tyrosine-type recombinase/integrase n=1 Tax=Pseudomonas sp. UBA7530 TaxID=1947341 RepID=UPI0025E42B43|nr:tyrosine-type recombinase/integrase [Pseudomonas sp. UBA7530]